MSSHAHTESHGAHQSHFTQYLYIFLFLAALTIVTVAVSRVNFADYGYPFLNIIVAMLIASIKAGTVALFFMHLKYENPLTWLYAAFPLILLALLIGLVFLDEPLRVVPTGIRENGKAEIFVPPGSPTGEAPAGH